jgi:hypothetical protein
MGRMSQIVKQLSKERTRLANELHKVTAALTAFGKVYLDGAKPTRKLSADARRRISLAQKKRWAKTKQKQEPQKPKRTMSAAARKRIGDATRARWAKLRAKKKAA